MNKKTIETKLNQEIEQSIPDIFDSIVNTPIVKMEEHDYITRQSMVKRPMYQKKLLAVCMCFTLIIAVFTSWYQFSYADSIIAIDVNPSIEITSNRQGKVLKVEAFNDDANIILENINLKKVDLDSAINAIMSSMIKNGYINANSNIILLSVKNEDAAEAAKLQEHLANTITASISKEGITPAIIEQTISADDNLKKLSKEYNVSSGKIAFINQLIKLDSSLDFEQLSQLSLQELMQLVKNKQIDIHKFVNYKDNDFDNSNDDDENNQDSKNDQASDDDSRNIPSIPSINSSKPNQNTVKDANSNKADYNENKSSAPTSSNNIKNDIEEDDDTDDDKDDDTDKDHKTSNDHKTDNDD